MKKIRLKIILVYMICIILGTIALYITMPEVMSYGPGATNTEFDTQMFGLPYYIRVIVLMILSCITYAVYIFIKLRNFDKIDIYLNEYKKTYSKKSKDQLEKIKKSCYTFHNKFAIFTLTMFVIVSLIVTLIFSYSITSYIRMFFILFCIFLITFTVAGIPTSSLLNSVLIYLENYELPKKTNSTFFNLLRRYFPLLVLASYFILFYNSALFEKEKGDDLYDYYYYSFYTEFSSNTYTSPKELILSLNNIQLEKDDDILFVLMPGFKKLYSTSPLSTYFLSYAKELSSSYNYKVYDINASFAQGILYPIEIEGETYYIGARYCVFSDEVIQSLSLKILYGLVGEVLVLFFIQATLAKELNRIQVSLDDIISSNDISRKLTITSYDDFGKITEQINELKSMTIDNANEIENNETRLMEKERLSTLGGMIGGVSHNLKTPIMSVSGAVEGLNDLISEYDSSIGDPQVTKEDYHAIASDMKEWTGKISSYLEYMSDIITTVKDQAITTNDLDNESFTIEELLKRVHILMKHELKHSYTELEVTLDIPETTSIKGNMVCLIQVINNMISNSIQAYNGLENQKIELHIYKEKNNIIFTVKDYAGGLAKEAEEKLFKDTITTKGKNGSGLGLYMSYSSIKSNFNGEITFTTEKGKGTEFKIIIPNKKGGTNEEN